MSIDYTHRYPLRRETAIELSPSKPAVGVGALGGGSSDTSGGDSTGGAIGGVGGSTLAVIGNTGSMLPGPLQIRNERFWQRNASMDQQQTYQSASGPARAASDFLNPPYDSNSRFFKKSSESLQKNSSTETDYSVHPYRFIKQSSNDTTTSMTGSYNVDTPSLTAEPSLDTADNQAPITVAPSITTTNISTSAHGSGLSLTGTSSGSGSGSGTGLSGIGISTSRYQPLRTASVGAGDIKRRREEGVTTSLEFSAAKVGGALQPQSPRAMQLRKQFSQTGQSKAIQPQHTTHIGSSTKVAGTSTTIDVAGAGSSMPAQTTSKLISSFATSLKPPAHKLGMNVLKESSSSTEESKDGDKTTTIPQISTDLVQDEIAKLSSNIKSSTDSEKDPPYNETMC